MPRLLPTTATLLVLTIICVTTTSAQETATPPNIVFIMADDLGYATGATGKWGVGHQFLYWEFFERGLQQAVRHGPYKAIRLTQGKPLQLFNVIDDPAEQKDIAERHPEVIAKVEAYLKTARTESPFWP